MPKKSKVGRCFDKLVASGKPAGSAAAICQSATGQSVVTGRKAKTHEGRKVKK